MEDYSRVVRDHLPGEVVFEKDIGDCQGDLLYLLYHPESGMYGFLVQEYDSCSVCDALEAHLKEALEKEADWNGYGSVYDMPWEARDDIKEEAYESFAKGMIYSTVWRKPEEMVTYLNTEAEGFFLEENQWEDFKQDATRIITGSSEPCGIEETSVFLMSNVVQIDWYPRESRVEGVASRIDTETLQRLSDASYFLEKQGYDTTIRTAFSGEGVLHPSLEIDVSPKKKSREDYKPGDVIPDS